MEKIKNKNTKYLSSIGIEVPNHLPLIESLDEVSPKTAQEIAGRLSALAYIIGLGFDAPGSDLREQLNKFHLMPFVSNFENELLHKDTIEHEEKVLMSWLVESAQALAWCIGVVSLDHFTHCDDDLAQKLPLYKDPSPFIRNARLRPISEIQEQSDLLYRMHWYARNCSHTGNECALNEGILFHRRKAIDWAYGVESDWDQVPMDT